MPKKSAKKGRSLHIRIDEESDEYISAFSESFNVTKSELIRNSIAAFIFLNFYNKEQLNPQTIFSINLLNIFCIAKKSFAFY